MEADTALPKLGRQVQDSRVAAIDYTQLSEQAASESQPEKSLSNLQGEKLQPFSEDCYTNSAMLSAKRRVPCLLLCCVSLLLSRTLLPAQETNEPQTPPGDLVRQTVAQEVAAANRPQAKYMFRARKQTTKGSQTRLYVETDDALAGMLVAVNDQPISAEQHQQENGHLTWLMNNPDQLRKKHAREKEDEDRTFRIVRALPDAFRYEYAGLENGDSELGKPGDQFVRLKFVPNPGYNPPSHVEQVLQGMQGYLVIDRTQRRIARIDGTLFREVSFGWGIMGHLDKGGLFRVQQADVGDGCWEITAMSLKMTGKILIFKGFSMISDETFSDFQRVPDNLPFAKGVDLLKTEQEKLAHNHEPEPPESKKTPQ